MMRRLKRIAGVGLGVATIMIGYLLVVYLHAQQACTCEQVCSTQGCWEGNCPSPCVLKFVQRFVACCTLYHSGEPLACCEATVEKYACVPPPAPVPVPGGPIHTPTYYLYRCRLHHLWHHGPQTVQVMCFLSVVP
jgi:hypothetical protein